MADNNINIGVKVESGQAKAGFDQLQAGLEQVVSAINAATDKLASQFAAATQAIANSMQNALKSVQEATGGISKGAAEAGKSSHDLAEALGGALSKVPGLEAVDAVVKLGLAIKDQADATKNQVLGFAQAAQAAGTSVEKYVALKDSLDALQLPSERLPEHLNTLANSIQQAASGSGAAKTAFEQLGIATDGWKNRIPPTDEVLLQLADHIKSSKNPKEALAAATKLLGDREGELIPFLQQGSAAIREQIKAHEDNGKAVADSIESARALKAEETALSEQLQTALLPAFRLFVTAVQGVHIEFIELKAIAATVEAAIVEKVSEIIDRFKGLAAVIKDIATGHFSAIATDVQATFKAIASEQDLAAATTEEIWKDANKEIAKVLADPPKAAAQSSREVGTAAEAGASQVVAATRRANQSRQSDTKATNQLIVADFGNFNQQLEKNGQDAVDKAAANNKKVLADLRANLEQRKSAVAENDKAEDQVEEQAVEQQLLRGKISQQQEIAQIAALKRDELQIDINFLRAKEKLYQGDAAEIAKIEDQITKLQGQQQVIQAKAVTDSLKVQRQQFDQHFKQISSQFNTAINGWIQGTETASQAFTKLFQSVLQELISFVEQWIEKKAEAFLADHLFSQQSDDDRAAQLTENVSANVAEAESAAGLAGANTLASVSIIDPFNAPEIAAENFGVAQAFAGIAGFALGGVVPLDGIAKLHRGETVIPANLSGKGDFGGVIGQGGGVTVVVNHSVNAIDAASFQTTIKRHGNLIGNEVARVLKQKGFGGK